MSRQWRSDDTDKWRYGFGNGLYGNFTLTGNNIWYVNNGAQFPVGYKGAPTYATIVGTSGQLSATTTVQHGWNTFWNTDGEPCLIYQARGTGAGNWELNIVRTFPNNTGVQTTYFKHPLQNNYNTSGVDLAIITKIPQYKTFTINSGASLTNGDFDGDRFGVSAILVSGKMTINGSFTANGAGFRGGAPGTSPGNGQTQSGFSGESYNSFLNANGGGVGGSGGGWVSPDTAAQYNGGSGGRGSRGEDGASGGGGGGHAANGTNGSPKLNNSPHYNGGYGGGTGGNASLTSMIFGGGGGGAGCWHDAGANTAGNHYGGDGGGIIIIMAKEIEINGTTGLVAANGANGANSGDGRGGSGGGAGGSVLIKCMTGTFNTNRITATGGAGGSKIYNNTGGGGAGSVGRIHVDYSISYSGSTNPTLDVRQDPTIIQPQLGGSFLYNFL